MQSTKPQGLISRVCRAIHENTPISIWGDGGNTKDYLFLDDFLDALEIIIDRGLTGTFNVASERSLSVQEIVSLVESFAGKKLKLVHCPAFPWDVEESRISAQKLRAATGWRARSDIAEAVQQVIEAELKCVQATCVRRCAEPSLFRRAWRMHEAFRLSVAVQNNNPFFLLAGC